MNNVGTFKCCTNCKECVNCCQSFNILNSPVLCKEEVKIISRNYDKFYDKVDENLYTLKTYDNHCIFYQNSECIIYDQRPLDCRLYPFDIIEKDNKYYLILYKLDCLNKDLLLNDLRDIYTIINKIKPWIKVFTDKRNYSKMINKEYVVIKEII